MIEKHSDVLTPVISHDYICITNHIFQTTVNIIHTWKNDLMNLLNNILEVPKRTTHDDMRKYFNDILSTCQRNFRKVLDTWLKSCREFYNNKSVICWFYSWPTLREKCPYSEFLVRIFPHSDWIRKFTLLRWPSGLQLYQKGPLTQVFSFKHSNF